jgi:hypothetical protein
VVAGQPGRRCHGRRCGISTSRAGRGCGSGDRARARDLYEHQDFSFIGDCDDRFLEEYTCQIRSELTSAVVTVTRNPAGRAQQIVVNLLPRSSVLLFARAMGEKFVRTALAEIFSSRES